MMFTCWEFQVLPYMGVFLLHPQLTQLTFLVSVCIAELRDSVYSTCDVWKIWVGKFGERSGWHFVNFVNGMVKTNGKIRLGIRWTNTVGKICWQIVWRKWIKNFVDKLDDQFSAKILWKFLWITRWTNWV